jgi:hypothetical protein
VLLATEGNGNNKPTTTGQWEERDLILSMGRKEKQELNPPETGDAGDKIR